LYKAEIQFHQLKEALRKNTAFIERWFSFGIYKNFGSEQKKGIARDIIREARNGYDAVVTRRRGMTGLRSIVLGSVATKLVENP
jgi:nucleotide-binding universal stress UspA family protein